MLGSIPVNIDADWSYDVLAIDPDDDPIAYSLPVAPAGATIDSVTGLVNWIPVEPGDYAFSVQAADNRGGVDVQEFVVTVTMGDPNGPPVITSVAPTQAAVNRKYVYPVQATDPDQDRLAYYLQYADPNNPIAGLSIDAGSGRVTWTPTAGQEGSHSFSVLASDGRGGQSAPESITVTVSAALVNTAPVIQSTAPTAAVVGETYRYAPTVVDAEADELSFDLPVAPIGMTVDPLSGLVVWTPTAEQVSQNFNAILRVRDSFGGLDLEPFRVHVDATNSPPEFLTTPPAGPAVVGKPYSYPARAYDANGDVVVYSLDSASLAKGMAVGAVTGVVTWTPTAAQKGSHTITLTADDQRPGGTRDQTFTLQVADAAPNNPPTISTTALPGPAAATKPYKTRIAASDLDGDALTFLLDAAPAGMQIDADTGVITWTPTAADVSATAHEVIVSVLDVRGARVFKDYALSVESNPTNRAPTISTTSLPGPAAIGIAYRAQIAASDLDGDALVYSVDAASAGKGIAISADPPGGGLLTWTPFGAQVGSHSITVTVDDGRGGSASQAFSLQVNSAPATGNVAPVINTTSIPSPAVQGVPYQVQIDATDANGDTLAFSLRDLGSGLPAGMAIDSAGLITWPSPLLTADGSAYTFGVQASDGRGGTASSADYTLGVVDAAVNTAPEITSTAHTRVRSGQLYRYPITAVDADGDPLTYSLDADVNGVPPPAGMSIVAFGGRYAIEWNTQHAALGSYPVRLRVEDGRGGYDVENITLQVVSQSANEAPQITSNPPTLNATLGRQYRYDLAAVDPDGDPLHWKLVTGPGGMALNPLTGELRWTPQLDQMDTVDQLGAQPVEVQVVDPYGGSDRESFTLMVRAVNLAPYFTSTPLTDAVTGQLYTHQVRAVDPEAGPITFSIVGFDSSNPPVQIPAADLTIDAGGVVRWTPTVVGDYQITVTATDDVGASNDYAYTLVVADSATTSTNRPPYFTASAIGGPVEASVGELYEFYFQASDPERDAISFALTEAPAFDPLTMAAEAEMTIDAASGQLTWTPDAAHLTANGGLHYFTVEAAAAGQTASVRYEILVRPPNNAPAITSTAPVTITAGQTYRYDVIVSDADSDPISYVLVAAPAGMTIDRLGRITWAVAGDDPSLIAAHRVEIEVNDGRGGFDSEVFDLTVLADTTAPKVNIKASPNPVATDDQATIVVSAVDDVGVASLELTVDGPGTGGAPLPLAVNSRGVAVYTSDTPGSYTLLATAIDAAGNTTQFTATLVVASADPAAPLVSITAPDKDGGAGSDDDGAIITAPVPVTGSASDPSSPGDLKSYRVEVFTLAGRLISTIADVSDPLGGAISDFTGSFGTFDPTLLENGPYLIRLTAEDLAGHVSATERLVHVDGRLKLGNFSLSFTDLTIPVAGIPITITRSYNTLHAGAQGDFGYGWSLGYGSTKVQVDLDGGALSGLGALPPFRDNTRVLVTREDGSTEAFRFEPWVEYRFLGLVEVWHPYFTAEDGNNSFLDVLDVELSKLDGESHTRGHFYCSCESFLGRSRGGGSLPSRMSRPCRLPIRKILSAKPGVAQRTGAIRL